MPPRQRPAPRLLSSMGLLFVLAAVAALVGFVAITVISKLAQAEGPGARERGDEQRVRPVSGHAPPELPDRPLHPPRP